MFNLNSVLKLAPAFLLGLPTLVSAAPVYVEYDVHVSDSCGTLCDGSGYHPGDRLSGWLKIDTDRAPPDRFAGEAGPQPHSVYWVPDARGVASPDFISGTGWPYGMDTTFGDSSGDAVSVIDDSGKFRYQGYSVFDYSRKPNGAATILELHVSTEDLVDNFIHGTGLVQSFDSEDLKGDMTLIGRLTQKLNGLRQFTLDFVVDRLSVTPGHCRAPG